MFFFVIVFLVTIVFAGLIVYYGQTYLIFPATRAIYRNPGSPPFNWAYEDVFVQVDEYTTHGWFIPLDNARGTVLFSHGNAGNIADRLESIQLLRSMGFSVLAYDYGGYGLSSGQPSEQRVYKDAEAMWDYLVDKRKISPNKIILFGRSLGGAATAYLAERTVPAAVVLESTFMSIPDVVKDMPAGFLLSKMMRHRFPNITRIAGIRSPLMVIHSPDDTLIPFKHGKALFDNAPEPKYFFQISGDHNDGFVLSKDGYIQGWTDFINHINVHLSS